jgi:uncharacterized protein
MAKTPFRYDPRFAATLLPLMLATVFSPAASAQGGAREVELSAGIHLIHAETATTDAERTRGLMFRRALEPNHGMLFSFDQPTRECMWMRNTLIPLAVAFIDPDGRVVNIEEMQPQTDTSHCAKHAVAFALEMAGGWFASHGVVPGSVISGLARKR